MKGFETKHYSQSQSQAVASERSKGEGAEKGLLF